MRNCKNHFTLNNYFPKEKTQEIFYLKFKCNKNPKKGIIARYNKNTNRMHYIIKY